MADQTVVSAAAIINAFFETLIGGGDSTLDFVKQGNIYYVEANVGSDNNDGSDWEHAFKTLKYAITVSNASIALNTGWASRNTIFVKGDACDEDLTNGATKCDIVGVGSCDAQPMARILGTHAFTGGASLMGMRFFNFEFWNDSADANFTFTTCDGIEFHNCKFSAYGTGATPATYALVWDGATGSDVVIEDCIFRPMNTGSKYSIAAILLDQVTCNGLVIRNNIIDGVVGIDIDSVNLRQGYIDNNLIRSTGMAINDASSAAVVTNNRFITDVDSTTLTDCVVINVNLACDNKVTGTTAGMKNYPALVA